MRRILWLAAFANTSGGLLFAFPASAPGQLAGLPAHVPATYRALAAVLVWLLGGTYAWLAVQPVIVRPMVAFGAIGKALAFFTFVALWLGSAATFRSVALMSADLAFAAAFFAWLRGNTAKG